MRRPPHSRTLLRAALLVGVAAAAQQHSQAPVASIDAPGDVRQRWDAMSEPEREGYRARFDELQKLDQADREELRRRAQRLDQLARTTYRSLDAETRAELDQLPVHKRRELLREMAVAEARELGRRILAKLPPEDRDRLQKATPADRVRFFLEFEERQARRLDEAIERDGAEFLNPRELQRLRGLGDQERREKFLEIVKRRTIRWGQEYGLPEGIGQRRWEGMQELPPPEFWMALERVRRQHRGFGRPDARPTADEATSLLMRAMHVELEAKQRLGFSHLDSQERRQRMRGLQRERVLQVVREQGLLEGSELERFERCADDQFFSKVRSMVSEGSAGSGAGGDGS